MTATYKCNKCGNELKGTRVENTILLDGIICTCSGAIYETIKAPAPRPGYEIGWFAIIDEESYLNKVAGGWEKRHYSEAQWNG